MTVVSDELNCIKNLLQVMCANGAIHAKEKTFLVRAANTLGVQIDDWKGLLKEVLGDDVPLYPMANHDKAVATLKGLITMSRGDGAVVPKEKKFVLQFAKSIGIQKSQWKQILSDIDPDQLFEPFTRAQGRLLVVTDDFEKLDAFIATAGNNGAETEAVDLQTVINKCGPTESIVCFHAAEDKDVSVTRCQMLLDTCGDKLVCILTRFQGHQVKYLLEIGLKKCIIEPVYARDINELFSTF